jgi:uncharacterized protein (TIGR03067 family)
MTADLLALSDWLAEAGVTQVAMESTGVYWKPIFNILEGRFPVLLANPQHLRRVPGRKTDVKDCEWIAQLLQCGLVHTVKKVDEVIQAGTQKLDPSKSPKAIDVKVTEGPAKGALMLGIYEINGDTLKVCFDAEGKKRPTHFKSAPGSATFVNVHKRLKK